MDRLDFCGYSKGIVGMIPAVNSFRQELASVFPELPFDCPILPKTYKAHGVLPIAKETWNMTVEEFKEFKKTFNTEALTTPRMLPNGVYRFLIQFFNDFDPAGFTAHYQAERYFRMNDENF